MEDMLTTISENLSEVGFNDDLQKDKDGVAWYSTDFRSKIGDNWPLNSRLNQMMDNGKLGTHVSAVIASVNKLLPIEVDFFQGSHNEYNIATTGLVLNALGKCWGSIITQEGIQPLFGFEASEDYNFTKKFLRVLALYHDIGKLIAAEHHVSRGVHLMRDVKEEDRISIESLFRGLWEKRCFWLVLGHHDIFGCLCTGEASIAAMTDMVSWAPSLEKGSWALQSPAAQFSLLLWLNIADSNATFLLNPLHLYRGLTTVEARRYLEDWQELMDHLLDGKNIPRQIKREEFKNWALNVASQPERAIQRITRLIASSFRNENAKLILDDIDLNKLGKDEQIKKQQEVAEKSITYEIENQIQSFVEEELQILNGPRFEKFCLRFARFCKFDYAFRFFNLLMADALEESEKDEQKALKNMTSRTCAILHRIVEEYGHLVDETSQHVSPRLGVDMSKLRDPGF